MKNKLYLCGLVLLVITFFTVKNTYALFETNANADADFQLGKWEIILNGKDITLDKTITLDDFTFTNNSHVEDTYFAPSTNAEFEIHIDASSSDVSVEYLIDIDDSSLDNHPNIHFKIIDLDTNEEMISNSTNGVLYLGDRNRTKNLKIVLNWENINEYDESDSELIDTTLSFDMTANFKQYIGD